MWLHKAYRAILSESMRANIRGACRRVMPRAFEAARRGVIGPAIDTMPPASTAMTPILSRYDELYFARRNPLIQALIQRIETGEPLDSVMRGFDATIFDERPLYIVACAEWLRDLPARADLVDFSGTTASKMLNQSFASKCSRVCFANMDDATSTVMRTYEGSRFCDGYQRFPQAYGFGGAIGLWCRPRKQFNLVLSGFTIPGKNALYLKRPFADSCKTMSASLISGGRFFAGVVDEQADPDAVASAIAALAECGIEARSNWFRATTDGWVATQPAKAARSGDGECAIAAIIQGIKE